MLFHLKCIYFSNIKILSSISAYHLYADYTENLSLWLCSVCHIAHNLRPLIYNIYLQTENMTYILHITVKNIIQWEKTIEKKSCLCLTVSNAEYCDLFPLASPSSRLTL